MRALWTVLTAFVVLSLVSGADANERLKLFKEYWYGQPLEEIRKDPNAQAIAGTHGREILTVDTIFMGARAKLIFQPLDTKDALSSVNVLQEWDPEQFERLNFGLQQTFLPIFALSHGNVMDYVDAGSTGLEASAARRRFEDTAIAAGDLRIFMIERSAIRSVNDVRNADDAVANQKDNARTALLAVLGDDLVVTFRISRKEDNVPVEDF